MWYFYISQVSQVFLPLKKYKSKNLVIGQQAKIENQVITKVAFLGLKNIAIVTPFLFGSSIKCI